MNGIKTSDREMIHELVVGSLLPSTRETVSC